MDTDPGTPLRERTDAKLRFSGLHLDELRAQKAGDGSDFDRAHQESFLFHLFGARDSFLSELNHYYSLGLPLTNVSLGKLRARAKAHGKDCAALTALYQLEQDVHSWYARAKVMRDHSAHVQGVRRVFCAGGADDGKIALKHPETGEESAHHVLDELRTWQSAMAELVNSLRDQAGSESARDAL